MEPESRSHECDRAGWANGIGAAGALKIALLMLHRLKHNRIDAAGAAAVMDAVGASNTMVALS